jgi:hypothetical protein
LSSLLDPEFAVAYYIGAGFNAESLDASRYSIRFALPIEKLSFRYCVAKVQTAVQELDLELSEQTVEFSSLEESFRLQHFTG